jgi:hypothetical protein
LEERLIANISSETLEKILSKDDILPWKFMRRYIKQLFAPGYIDLAVPEYYILK